MVRFVKDQPDAYIYSSFGSRMFVAGFLLTLVFILEAIAVYMFSDIIVDRIGSRVGFLMKVPLISMALTGIIYITTIFMPIIGATTLISLLVLKRTYKKLEKLNVNSTSSQTLIMLARLFFIGAGLATYAPLFMIFEAMINKTIPVSTINYFQTQYMSLFFTLLGIGLFLTLISPVVQLYGRTKSKSLIFSGLLAFLLCSIIIYLGNGDWNISIFQLSESSEFKSSFATAMGTAGICILIIFWIISNSAKSILKYQKLHFTMKLGE
tara:strand:+ start:185 stop:982 length:798 start_codon:yes stop_codon:yes gene_type:complete